MQVIYFDKFFTKLKKYSHEVHNFNLCISICDIEDKVKSGRLKTNNKSVRQ